MTTTSELTQSRTFPATLERAWEVVLAAPLERVFDRRFGPLPQVTEVRDQDGDWGRVGQTRTIVLADGGTMREELTAVTEREEFRYRITDVTGPMKLLVDSLEGRWSFEPAGTGVRVTWAWTVHPASALGEIAMPAFGWLWKGYARQALETIETLLLED